MTVAELIAKLQALPQDAQVVIEDADTSWPLALTYVAAGYGDWSKLVVLSSDYEHRVEL